MGSFSYGDWSYREFEKMVGERERETERKEVIRDFTL